LALVLPALMLSAVFWTLLARGCAATQGRGAATALV
jgi:hypothetical protein